MLAAVIAIAGASQAMADGPDVIVAGSFPGAAVLVIDGGAPTTVRVGRVARGVKVLAVDGDAVTFEIAGQRQTLRAGERVANLATSSGSGSLVLHADSGGHFRTGGQINGARVEFLLDTGATFVSMGRSDAQRAGIDYAAGRRAVAQTANGNTGIWLVKVDQLNLGSLTLHNVDAAVHDDNLPVVLLGMSALSRFELRNEGQRMFLRQRY
ncbi:MAG: TIGR02281 family clan AA aspartic protease [Rhodocyclaceae bacterium]|nr:TIGR02281 family clan AA aspartic protease [Rhodocyclaceae bacterium]